MTDSDNDEDSPDDDDDDEDEDEEGVEDDDEEEEEEPSPSKSANRHSKRARSGPVTAPPPSKRAAIHGHFLDMAKRKAQVGLWSATHHPEAVALLRAPLPSGAAARQAVAHSPGAVAEQRQELVHSHLQSKFPSWKALLEHGHALALYGAGSKRTVAERFVSWAADTDPVLVMNGFQSGASLRGLVHMLISKVVGCKAPTGTVGELCTFAVSCLGGGQHRQGVLSDAPRTTELWGGRQANPQEDDTTPARAASRAARKRLAAPKEDARATPFRRTNRGKSVVSSRNTSSALALLNRARTVAGLGKHHSLEEHSGNVWILVHSADAAAVRSPDLIRALSELAAAPRVRMIVSLDHINSALLMDQRSRLQGRWVWQDCTTFAPFLAEASHSSSGTASAADVDPEALLFVLRSLTRNHRQVLAVIAELLLEPEAAEEGGVDLEQVLERALDRLIVASASALRTHLVELCDHELVSFRRGSSGNEVLAMPASRERLEVLSQGEPALEVLGRSSRGNAPLTKSQSSEHALEGATTPQRHPADSDSEEEDDDLADAALLLDMEGLL
jgi:hypothetical protein